MKFALAFLGVILCLVTFTQANAQTYSATLVLDPLPSQVRAGDTMTFSGQLLTSDGQYTIPNRTIYIKDDVDFGADTFLGSVVTNDNGEFAATWVATPRSSGSYDFYAVFEGDDYVQKARSTTYSVYVYDSDSGSSDYSGSGSGYSGSQQYQNYYKTTLTLDQVPSSIYAGQSITFTGRLTSGGSPVSNAIIKIMEDDPLSPDQLLSAGRTDPNGMFAISWQASKGYFETDFDIYATFDGDSNYLSSRSYNQQLSVLRYSGSIGLDPIPRNANLGDVVTFSGTLDLSQDSPEGAIVYIKDEDPLTGDDLLATAYVDRSGRFSANWFVTDVDADNEADIYAVFEGNDVYYRLTTCDPNPTMDYGGSCSYTIPLRINYAEPEPVQPNPDTSKQAYIDVYYSLDLSKNPHVAIVPNPDAYNVARQSIVPTQEGILMWKSYLDSKYGGNWNVSFEVITPDTLFFQSKPDVIVNLVTPEQEYGCNYDFYGYARISHYPVKPVQTVVCVESNGNRLGSDQVAATAAHEFIHAMGLGHTWNKQGDLMCSTEEVNGQRVYTCPNYSSGRSKIPSDLNLVGVTKLYNADGYKNPNNKVSFGSKVTLDTTTAQKTTETTSKTKSQKDYDKDKIPDYRDKCKTKPETYNGYKDTDGCPDKKPKK